MSIMESNRELTRQHRTGQLLTSTLLTEATEAKVTNRALAVQLGVTEATITYHRRRLGIPSYYDYVRLNAGLRAIPITPEVMGCIVGTVLGDGHLEITAPQRCCLAMAHSPKQSAWAEHKRQRLQALVTGKSWQISGKYGPAHRWRTVGHPDLLALHHIAYDESRRKRVTMSLLNKLTEEGLTWWFYDDGSAISCRRGKL